MSNIDIIRAWKDEEYRNSLSEEQRSQIPENPAGMTELSDKDMEALAGGYLAATYGDLQIGDFLSSNGDSNCSHCTNSYGCDDGIDTLTDTPNLVRLDRDFSDLVRFDNFSIK